jgi:hypothetical protein
MKAHFEQGNTPALLGRMRTESVTIQQQVDTGEWDAE